MMSKVLFLDIETTGFSRQWNEIIEIAAIVVDSETGKDLDSFHEYIKPRNKISAQVSELTGITNAKVANCRNESAVLMDFSEWVYFTKPTTIIGHNCKSFDLNFINARCQALGVAWDVNNISIVDTLALARDMNKQGKIKEFGLSNYPAWQVVDIWNKCERFGYLKPSVYQGMYNALCRNVEPELFPAIRSLGMRFYAFNPLAGGLLTGKQLDFDATPENGRFSRLKSYRDRYWKHSYFDALNEIKHACDQEGIAMVEAAYRWLTNHSLLDASKGDGILLGASRIEQMEQNMLNANKGELPSTILSAMDEAWQIAKPDSPAYFKFI